MMMRRGSPRHRRHLTVWGGVIALLLLFACTAAPEEPLTDQEGAGPTPPAEGADEATAAGAETSAATGGASEADLRLAAVFPGSVTDADYNTLGLLALESVEERLGIEVAYSENVPVPDVGRVMREYIDQGYNAVWTHGSQFYDPTAELAGEFPDVFFIGEFDAEPDDQPDNLWVIDRNFHIGFYPLGALAAQVSQTGRIGYIGGLSLPFSYSEVHAMRQAISDLGLEAEVLPVWTGDFNDPAAGRQLASQLLGEGVDVVVGSLNLGMVGVFEAVKQEPAGESWVTAKYTDKSQFAPDHYVTSVLYDFEGPLNDIVERILAGEASGYYPLGFDTGVALQQPLQNVSEDISTEVEQLAADIEAGDIEVTKDTSPIE